jgi:hypothetical protein
MRLRYSTDLATGFQVDPSRKKSERKTLSLYLMFDSCTSTVQVLCCSTGVLILSILKLSNYFNAGQK